MSTHETARPETATSTAPMMSSLLSWHDIRLVLSGTLLLLLLVALETWLWFLSPIRIVLGFFYVLYVPGYCLQAALFPRHDDLDNIERLGLSLGLSVAIIPVLALILNLLPWGLFLWPIMLGQLLVTLLFSGLVLWRRSRLPGTERYVSMPTFQLRFWWQSLAPLEKLIYQLIAGISIFLLAAFIWVFAVPSPDEFMTEFYILGEEGLAENYPRNPIVGEELDVTMGIVNQERGSETYRVAIWVTWAWAPDEWWTLVEEEGPFTLEPGEQIEQPLTWVMPWEADDTQVYFRLYREGDDEPYRELLLWMDVLPNPEETDIVPVPGEF